MSDDAVIEAVRADLLARAGREEARERVIVAAREVAMKYDDFSEPEGIMPPEYNAARRELYDALVDLDSARPKTPAPTSS